MYFVTIAMALLVPLSLLLQVAATDAKECNSSTRAKSTLTVGIVATLGERCAFMEQLFPLQSHIYFFLSILGNFAAR